MNKPKIRRISIISLATCSLLLLSPRPADAMQIPLPAELTGLVQQVNQLITSINSGDFLKSQMDKLLGQYLPQVQAAITESIGLLGLPDPSKAEAEVLAQIKGAFNSAGLNDTLLNQGVVTSAITNTSIQNVLGEEGQARLKKTLEDMLVNAQNVGQLSLNTATGAETSKAIAEVSQQIAANSVTFAQNSLARSQQIDGLSQQAQAALSTQDVLKIVAQQNAGNSAILANIASQFGNNANQVGNVASQLGQLSEQNSQVAEQNSQRAQIDAQQLALQVQQTQQGATSLLNLDQINASLKGDRQDRLIERNSTVQQRMPYTFLR
jgi:tRNA nucleotidyltransferase/poly(A) polymerase